MSRKIAVFACAALLAVPALRADEAQTLVEIRELKMLIEQQMKRIDELTVHVGRLHQAVEAQKAAAGPSPLPRREVGEMAPYSGSADAKMQPARTRPETVPTEPAAAPEAPKAEAVAGVKHTVAKGETLTSIAKNYNIALADLQKANKDVNDRKLQIGQVITIPVTRTEATTPDKKDIP